MPKRPKTDAPTALRLLVPARETRESVAEFQPMVLYMPRRGRGYTAILEPGETLDQMLEETLANMRMALGPAEWVAVTTDAFVKMAPESIDVQPGDLGRAFKEGDPKVIEQMIVVLKIRNQPAQMATQTYRWSMQDGFEWDDPEVIAGHQGDMIEIMNKYI